MTEPDDAQLRSLLASHQFTLRHRLGRGGGGLVLACTCQRSHADVALKLICKARAQELGIAERVIGEVTAHSRLRHPHIVDLLDFFEDDVYVYLVMEHASGGDVYQLLHARGRGLSVTDVRIFGAQLCSAIAHMHAHGIMHRDLKLSNLLLQRREGGAEDGAAGTHVSDTFDLKLADYGLAVSLLPTAEHITVCGTPAYMSPEVAHAQPYSASADVYSLGCLLYALGVGRPPDQQELKGTAWKATLAGCVGSSAQPLIDVIAACVRLQPEARPTAAALASDTVWDGMEADEVVYIPRARVAASVPEEEEEPQREEEEASEQASTATAVDMLMAIPDVGGHVQESRTQARADILDDPLALRRYLEMDIPRIRTPDLSSDSDDDEEVAALAALRTRDRLKWPPSAQRRVDVPGPSATHSGQPHSRQRTESYSAYLHSANNSSISESVSSGSRRRELAPIAHPREEASSRTSSAAMLHTPRAHDATHGSSATARESKSSDFSVDAVASPPSATEPLSPLPCEFTLRDHMHAPARVRVHTRSGSLTVQRDSGVVTLSQGDATLTTTLPQDALASTGRAGVCGAGNAASAGCTPVMITNVTGTSAFACACVLPPTASSLWRAVLHAVHAIRSACVRVCVHAGDAVTALCDDGPDHTFHMRIFTCVHTLAHKHACAHVATLGERQPAEEGCPFVAVTLRNGHMRVTAAGGGTTRVYAHSDAGMPAAMRQLHTRAMEWMAMCLNMNSRVAAAAQSDAAAAERLPLCVTVDTLVVSPSLAQALLEELQPPAAVVTVTPPRSRADESPAATPALVAAPAAAGVSTPVTQAAPGAPTAPAAAPLPSHVTVVSVHTQGQLLTARFSDGVSVTVDVRATTRVDMDSHTRARLRALRTWLCEHTHGLDSAHHAAGALLHRGEAYTV